MTPTALSVGDVAAYFVAAVMLDVVVSLPLLPGVLNGDLINPDTFMRLVRLHDILQQRVPLHLVLRDGSGDGTLLHWSHLLDSLLLILAAPLRPWLDWDAALHGAAVVLGPVSVGLLGVAAAWAMAPLTERSWRWMAPVLTAVAPSISYYGLPGVAHHHVLLALAAVMMAGAAGRLALGSISAGCILGAWAAAGIWLSPESAPFAVMAFGGAGLAWLLRPRLRCLGIGIALAGSVFLLLVGGELAIDPPAGGYTSTAIDGISVVYVMLAAILCVIGWALFGLDRLRLKAPLRGALGFSVGAAGLSLWLLIFPVVLRGPEALSDTSDAQVMMGSIAEMLPITSAVDFVSYLLDGTGAALLLIWLAVRDRLIAWRSALWAYAALCVIAMVVLGQLHVRFATYGAAAAAVVLPIALSECTRLLSGRSLGLQATTRLVMLAVLLLANYTNALPGPIRILGPTWKPGDESCKVRETASMLLPYAGQVVLTDVNDVPELLYRTGIQTVGSLYRNVAAFSRLRAAWRSGPSDEEPEAVRATRATLVLFCRHAARSALVSDLSEQTLLDRLGRGEVPPWLQAVVIDPQSGFTLYRIIDPVLR